MAKVELSKLKEQALKAVEKSAWGKAAELYLEIAKREPEADWRQRAGETLRKAGDTAAAVEQFMLAAEGYAKGGFLLKAIAVCKVVLQIDPKHTSTQAMLAELYSQRDGGGRAPQPTPSGSMPVVAPVGLGRTQSGQFEMVAEKTPARPPASAPPPVIELALDEESPARAALPRSSPPRAAPPPPPPSAPPRAPVARLDDLISLDTMALDERPAARTLPPGAPMDVLPLHEVLGGRRSSQFPAVEPEPDAAPEAGAYEIELGEEDLSLESVAAEAAAHVAERAIPVAAPPAPAAANDDLDFSGLLDDAPPKPAAPPPAPRKPPPRIPLFSSLAPDRLVRLIERVALREAPAGEAIVRQGDRGGSLFVIVRGRVEVTLEGPPARALAHLTDGAFFGELALITDFPRSATVTAEEPTELLEISREVISEIVADSPEVLKTLLRFFRDRMLDRLIGTSPLFSSLSPDDARALVARFKFLELEAGMRVVDEGQRAPGMFLLLCGEAEVARAGRTIARLQPGELFGEMSLLTRGPAVASIRTASKCWALELERADFQEIMLTYPQVLEYVSGLAAARESAAQKIEFL